MTRFWKLAIMKLFLLLIYLVAKCTCDNEFSSRSRNFSIELLHFTQQYKDGHVVISPFGIWTLMAGIALGTAGNTYEQLARAFILPRNSDHLINGYKNLTKSILGSTTKGVSISSTNFVFVANDFQIRPDYKTTLASNFGAIIEALNFDDPELAAKKANSYIRKSGASVANVLTSNDFVTSRMLLANVISFQGLWSLPFNKSETTEEPFYNENREMVGKVNMMYQRGEVSLSYIVELKSYVLEMPYGNDGKYSMLFILPHPNQKVVEVYKKFDRISLEDIFKQLDKDNEDYGLEEIDVKIPRFKISTNVILNKPLNDMGVYDIFEQDKADFKKVTNENIFVSAIVHKADIEATESGTVASAASIAGLSNKITGIKFVANRPFIYFLMERPTTTVIFGGIYSKPSLF